MQLTATIEVSALTLGDWLAISKAVGNSDKYALYKWLENTTEETLTALTVNEWFDIAKRFEYSGAWAAKKYGEYAAKAYTS